MREKEPNSNYVNTIFRATGISLGKNSIGKFKRQKIAKSSLKRNFFNLRENF